MGLPNLTPEEEYLLKKFAQLKKKVDLGLISCCCIDLFSTFLYHITFARQCIFCLVITEEGASKVEGKD